jgi:hypothetical protein
MWFLAHFFLLFRVAPSVVKDWPFRHTRLAQTRFEQVTIVLSAYKESHLKESIDFFGLSSLKR